MKKKKKTAKPFELDGTVIKRGTATWLESWRKNNIEEFDCFSINQRKIKRQRSASKVNRDASFAPQLLCMAMGAPMICGSNTFRPNITTPLPPNVWYHCAIEI